MNHKTNKGLILLLVLLFAGLLASVGRAEAAVVDWRSTWNVTGDFVGNTPNVLLTVTVERNTGAGWVLYAQEARQLECSADGGVVLAADTAVFDGTGHIRCAMPSVRSLVRQATNGRYTPDPFCDCKGNPLITADVALDPNITGSVWENPLVQRTSAIGTDMALAAEVPAFSTLPQASLLFTVGVVTAQSNPFLATAVPNALLATYIDLGGKQAAFEANGADPGTGAAPVPGLLVSNEATTLYIGYSPLTGASLHGTLTSFSVDPGCYGTG